MRPRSAPVATLAVCLGATLVLAACSSGTDSGSPSEGGDDNNKVFYVVKRLDQGWFQNEQKGVEEGGKAAGLDVTTLDSRFDASVQQSSLDTAFSQDAGGVILVIQDQELGPAVMAQAKTKNVPVIAVDDPIEDADGDPVPFVGMATDDIGTAVGKMLATSAQENGWDVDDIGVAALTFDEVSVCTERTDASKKGLLANLPGLSDDQIYEANYAGANTDGGLQAMQGLITSHPDVKHWLVYSCNEEGVVGGVRALEAADLDADSCGVGLGDGALAKVEFEKGTRAYCGSLFANSKKHGEVAAQLMADFLLDGKELPLETLVPGVEVTSENYAEVFSG